MIEHGRYQRRKIIFDVPDASDEGLMYRDEITNEITHGMMTTRATDG